MKCWQLKRLLTTFRPIFTAHVQKRLHFYFRSNFYPNLKFSCALSYSTTQIAGAYANISASFENKTAFVMQNFGTLGLVGVGNYFRRNPKKAHSYPSSHRKSHEASHFIRWFWPYERSRNKKATRGSCWIPREKWRRL